MEQSRNSYQSWWIMDQALTAVVTVIIPLGCNVLNAFRPTGILGGVGLTRDLSYFAFNLTGTYTTATLLFRVEVGSSTAALSTWFTHPHSGSGNVDSVHNLAAPYGGAPGFMALSTTYLRLSVDIGGVGNVTGFNCMARAWKE